MGIIKQLTPDIYNHISAGEVVERPASAIKELVENSIDAGASRINISIEGGGIDYIEVADNGCGMDEDDIVVAFRPHATSKLSNALDLFNITTLGFRGEALASISAVGDITVTTKTPYADTAVSVSFCNGVAVDKQYVSYNSGTKVAVSDLFHNVPARKKFLKATSRETATVTKYINNLILCNPLLEVNYTVDGQYVYQFKGTGLEEAIHCIYGNKCLENCLPVNSEYKGITVRGYIGNPQYTKGNSTYQTLSINGRYVKNETVAAAVKQAYLPFLVSRSYPFYVLEIEMDTADVDVNVHPNKLEVRFADTRKIFVAISYPIKEALQRCSEHRIQRLIENNTLPEQCEFRLHATRPVDTNTSDIFVPFEPTSVLSKTMQSGSIEYSSSEMSVIDNNSRRFHAHTEEQLLSVSLQALQYDDNNSEALFPHANEPVLDYDNFFLDNSSVISNEVFEKVDFADVVILGVLFDTYFVLEMKGQLVMIDQHAAHERILYDKYMATNANLTMQPLLIPHVITVSAEEYVFVEEHLAELVKAGFELEPFGTNSFRITAVASLFVNCKLDKLIGEILHSVEDDHLDKDKILSERIAMQACKHATKAGDRLTDLQIKTIVEQLFANKHLQCPHGRPISVELSRTEIEKMFKRIV